MSDGPAAEAYFERSEDLVYFKTIEALFIDLRGAPFQLSADDYRIARRWRAEGVPVDVALSTLRELVAKAVAKGADPKDRLSYYRRAVEQAWQRQRELTAPGAVATAVSIDVETRLRRLAAKVPASLPEIRQRVAALAEAGDTAAEAVDRALAEVDADMLAAARAALDDAARQELSQRIEASLAVLAGRLGGAAAGARERVGVRHLRELAGLPLLSLFSPDAVEHGFDPS